MRAPVTKKAGKYPAQAKTLTVEWEFAEDDCEWHSAVRTTPAVPPPAHHWGRRWWVASSTSLLFLLAAGGWLWYQAHAGLSQIQGELEAVVEAS